MIVLPDRYWEKVTVGLPDECWMWTGARDKNGYGIFQVDRSARRAHRLSFEDAVEPLGKLWALHRCDTPGCVNPAHLFAGTVQDNTADMIAKGRANWVRTLVTHCPRGHEFTAENTYRYRKQRICRACARRRGAAYYARQRELVSA